MKKISIEASAKESYVAARKNSYSFCLDLFIGLPCPGTPTIVSSCVHSSRYESEKYHIIKKGVDTALDNVENKQLIEKYPVHVLAIAAGLCELKDKKLDTKENREILFMPSVREFAHEMALAIGLLHKYKINTAENLNLIKQNPRCAISIVDSFEYLKNSGMSTKFNKEQICIIYDVLDKKGSIDFCRAMGLLSDKLPDYFDELCADPLNAMGIVWGIEQHCGLKR